MRNNVHFRREELLKNAISSDSPLSELSLIHLLVLQFSFPFFINFQFFKSSNSFILTSLCLHQYLLITAFTPVAHLESKTAFFSRAIFGTVTVNQLSQSDVLLAAAFLVPDSWSTHPSVRPQPALTILCLSCPYEYHHSNPHLGVCRTNRWLMLCGRTCL